MSAPAADVAIPDQQSPAVRSASKPSVQLVGPQGDLDQAYRLAQALAHSNLVPEALRGKPSNILVVILYGQELALPPMQAMQVIDVVKGRPTLRANLWVALARKAGHKVRISENTAEACTVTVIRHDDPEGPITARYTLEDAKTAGLMSNDNYRKNPKAMLYARAASTAIRQACPEVAMGFSDEYELLADDIQHADGPVLADVVGPRDLPAAAPADEPIDQAALADEYAEIVAEQGATSEDAQQ